MVCIFCGRRQHKANMQIAFVCDTSSGGASAAHSAKSYLQSVQRRKEGRRHDVMGRAAGTKPAGRRRRQCALTLQVAAAGGGCAEGAVG